MKKMLCALGMFIYVRLQTRRSCRRRRSIAAPLTPNGLAFWPDDKYRYVGNWDDHAKLIRRYEIRADAKPSFDDADRLVAGEGFMNSPG